MLIVIGDFLDLCEWYNNEDIPYKFSKLSCETLRCRGFPAGRFIVYQSNTNYTVAVYTSAVCTRFAFKSAIIRLCIRKQGVATKSNTATAGWDPNTVTDIDNIKYEDQMQKL